MKNFQKLCFSFIRYGRRSNWFKIHCLLQEQASQINKGMEGGNIPQGGMPSLSPNRGDEEGKVDSPALSSPESINSDTSIDVERRPPKNLLLSEIQDSMSLESKFLDSRRGTDLLMASRSGDTHIGNRPGDFIAGLGSLYGLHPGLSLLHASQLYSRLYPSQLYPGLAPPPLLSPSIASSSPPRPTPACSTSPTPPSPRPHTSPPATPISREPRPFISTTALLLGKKRGAESPLEDLCSPNGSPPAWEGSPAPEQDAPIDLSVKRPRLSPPTPHTLTPVSPPASPLHAIGVSTSILPVDMSTRA